MSSSVTIADLRAALAQLRTVRSYACDCDGVQLVAELDSRRLTRAELATRLAARIRSEQARLEQRAELAGIDYRPDAAALARATELAELASELRSLVQSFTQDREDAVLYRGRHKTRFARNARKGTKTVQGGAQSRTVVRAFAGGAAPVPSKDLYCSACGVRHNGAKYEAGQQCRCGGTLVHRWEQAELAERFAMAKARGEGARLAEHDGSAVQYDKAYDRAGVWLGTRTQARVGIDAVLEVRQWCPKGYDSPELAAEHLEAERRKLASRAAELAQLNASLNAATVTARQDHGREARRAARKVGRKSRRGKRAGRSR